MNEPKVEIVIRSDGENVAIKASGEWTEIVSRMFGRIERIVCSGNVEPLLIWDSLAALCRKNIKEAEGKRKNECSLPAGPIDGRCGIEENR